MKKFPAEMTKKILRTCSEKQWRLMELADEINYSRPAVSKKVSELRELGLMERIGEKRSRPVATTEKGTKFLYNCENKTDKAIVEVITEL